MIIWDFDFSLISVNSDEWIPAQFGSAFTDMICAGRERREQWTALMDRVAGAMYAAGVTADQLTRAAASMPIDDDAVAAVREAAAAGAEQLIVSDANSVYISELLSAQSLDSHFSCIVTNPAHFDARGCLRIEPAVSPENPHGCVLCPKNLCKGGVLRARQLVQDNFDGTIIYVGDGSGDVCPARALRSRDVVLARAEFPLAKALKQQAPSARVETWADYSQLRAAMRGLLGLSIKL
jgi:2,3-diketo-5-methylthio-1-phosphopentane phosphatase